LEVQEQLSREKPCLPVIIITGRDDPGVGERALAAGAVAYLKKPLDEQKLLAAIRLAVPESEKPGDENPKTVGISDESLVNEETR
jgi:FixJ family two-component response regulator